ncbi:MAG: hypothetical protein JXB62_07585 [Pirellulales bacterium]|nr:hypothetical protein [Pirellulales bacterium]
MLVHHRRRSRSGNVLVLTAFLMVVLFGLLTFAIDMGYLQVIRSQLQTSADATALAAAWDLIDEGVMTGAADPNGAIAEAEASAGEYASLNLVGGIAPALAEDDITIGHIADPANLNMTFTNPSLFNAVQVRVRRSPQQNGDIALFFAKVLGFNRASMQAEATAMFLANTSGFTTPSSGGALEILPFALDMETWNSLMARTTGDDNFAWDPDSETVSSGTDNVLEVNLFPQDTGSPGNRGTVDIGNTNNAVPDIRRQILYGISEADLVPHGGSLEFDANGQLFLNGDTGISAGVKSQLEQIIGQPRMIPLFTAVSGNGNNATYTIEAFAGIRLVEVCLTGSSKKTKRVMIQPAEFEADGMLPPNGTAPKSYFIHTPVYLVR